MYFDVELSLHLSNSPFDPVLELPDLAGFDDFGGDLGGDGVDLVLEAVGDGEGLLDRERLVDECLVEPPLPLDPLPVAQVHLHHHALQVLRQLCL